ncbi:hypothetical protein I7I51_04575 [Histoplasma capsulatum]|uniref:Uncharacterized protein n=1 Tax=Ajellomyces capsulatus TaxID=5037 RepID=A0A8A1M139_AJECA|nr:hypothetical protein I7I51_04575 [Histoplasma capsulatum]
MDATLGHGSMKVEEPSHTGARLLPPKILFNSVCMLVYLTSALLRNLGAGIAPFYARDNMNGAYNVDLSRMQRGPWRGGANWKRKWIKTQEFNRDKVIFIYDETIYAMNEIKINGHLLSLYAQRRDKPLSRTSKPFQGPLQCRWLSIPKQIVPANGDDRRHRLSTDAEGRSAGCYLVSRTHLDGGK